MKKYDKLLIPKYFKYFKCIGGECEDSCCIGWKVTIDKNTYKKYNKIKKLQLKNNIIDKIKRVKNSKGDLEYAEIKLDSNRRCPFLNKENFCDIYINCGQEYLSNTCTVYPRNYNKVDDIIEVALSMSCPHASRVALLNRQPMQFDMEEVFDNTYDNIYVSKEIATNSKNRKKILDSFWDLRIFTINLVQNREYKLWERLIILGSFYNKINTLEDREEVLSAIGQYEIFIKEGAFEEYLSKIPSAEEYQYKFIKAIIDSGYSPDFLSERYKECYEDFILGLGVEDGDDLDNLYKEYIIIRKTYFDKKNDEYEYILENYLVNLIFKELFPMNGNNVFEDYMMMIINYAYIKLLSIGSCGKYKDEFKEENLIKIIQSFSKNVEHNPIFIKMIKDFLKNNEMDTLAHMAILIKN